MANGPAPEANAIIERQLDQLVERLSGGGEAPVTRALLIEARRLRSIIANWRTVPPVNHVREEMLARIHHISTAIGDPGPTSRRAQPTRPGPNSTLLGTGMTGLNFDQLSGGANSHGLGQFNQGPGQFNTEETVVTDGFAALPITALDVHPITLDPHLSPHLVMFTDPHGQRADAYRTLRHRLSSLGDPKVIGVTSAGRREGKSTAAINLAASLREGARGRVLLVEANLRAPSLGAMLGFTPPVCFGEQLVQHRKGPLDPWVAVEPLSQLHVMGVNPAIKQSPILDPIGFSIAIDRLRIAGYDYIVVDTTPVLDSADVNMIADSVDGLVMTALAKKSDSKAVKRAINHIGAMTFLGTILLE